MQRLSPSFNTHRMLREYTEKYYVPAHDRFLRLTEGDLTNGRDYLHWWQRINSNWNRVAIKRVEVPDDELKVSEDVTVRAWVDLGNLTPGDVSVQLYTGRLDTQGFIQNGQSVEMEVVDRREDGTYEYAVTTRYTESGARGISVRVVPHHEYLNGVFQTGMVHWAAE